MKRILATLVGVTALVCTAAGSAPASAPSVALSSEDAGTILAGLTGTWEGSLRYRDYQSDRRVELPAKLENRMNESGDALVMEVAFTDPGRVVRSLDLVTISNDGTALHSASVAGGGIETETWTIVEWIRNDDGWQWILQREGMDGGKPAEMRLRRTLSGSRFRSVKEVRDPGDSDGEWTFRNELDVERVSPRAEDLVGRWKVDLRPTPDAEAYYQDLIFEETADGLGVTFYSTAAQDVNLNLDWGQTAFAFRTDDGSGGYFTSGRLVGDRIEGQTHAAGRGFFSLWTAERAD